MQLAILLYDRAIAGAALSARLISDAQLVVYKGAPHGMFATMKDRVNEDLLSFINTGKARSATTVARAA